MAAPKAPEISVVVPVYNEEGAAPALAREIAAAFKGRSFEIVFVDDASKDGTRKALVGLKNEIPELKVFAHTKNSGQSRAVRSGVLKARGEIIVTLDGDGQNDPADGPKLVDILKAGSPELALVGGERTKRQDSAAKKIASRWANGIRKSLLKDNANDTGCGLKVFRREAFLRLPYFDHIHRYLPALMIREGYENRYLDVDHRHRETGRSKYTNWGRLRASFSDLLGVMWLKSRSRRPGDVSEF